MPITLRIPLRQLTQDEFGELSYDVMRHVFAIHQDLGRFFDEQIYKRELAQRIPRVRLEEPIDITFGSFQKRCFIDVLVSDGGLFEFKAVNALAGRHRTQLLQYLMLCEAAHGKLINVRPEQVEHEFVNSHWTRADRVVFDVDCVRLNRAIPGAGRVLEYLVELLRDVGTGLGIAIYEEAVEHCFGGAAHVEAEVPVVVDGRQLGQQIVRLIAPGVALKITALEKPLDLFEDHARRWLAHVDLQAIVWVNIAMKEVTFTTFERT